eukprot:scaffold135131_cov19-Tisochrysis_lutea.AAC.1
MIDVSVPAMLFLHTVALLLLTCLAHRLGFPWNGADAPASTPSSMPPGPSAAAIAGASNAEPFAFEAKSLTESRALNRCVGLKGVAPTGSSAAAIAGTSNAEPCELEAKLLTESLTRNRGERGEMAGQEAELLAVFKNACAHAPDLGRFQGCLTVYSKGKGRLDLDFVLFTLLGPQGSYTLHTTRCLLRYLVARLASLRPPLGHGENYLGIGKAALLGQHGWREDPDHWMNRSKP